jgi:hypothetical protein
VREGLARRCDPVGVVGNKSEPGLVLRGAGACLRFLTMARCRRCGAVGRQFIWSRGAGETRAGVWQEGRGGAGRGAAGLAAGLEVLDGDGLEVDVDPHRDHHHLPQLRAQGSVGSGKAPLKPSRAITKKCRA